MSSAGSVDDGREFVLGYCTDVEGNLDFWHSYVEISPVL